MPRSSSVPPRRRKSIQYDRMKEYYEKECEKELAESRPYIANTLIGAAIFAVVVAMAGSWGLTALQMETLPSVIIATSASMAVALFGVHVKYSLPDYDNWYKAHLESADEGRSILTSTDRALYTELDKAYDAAHLVAHWCLFGAAVASGVAMYTLVCVTSTCNIGSLILSSATALFTFTALPAAVMGVMTVGVFGLVILVGVFATCVGLVPLRRAAR